MTTAFDIVSAIRARMAEMHYSQNRLARNIGRHRTSVAHWLDGYCSMPLDAACEVLHTLGLDLEVVWRDETDNPINPTRDILRDGKQVR